MKTAILLLAAGNSSRLGQPKQLLRLGGKSLLAHSLLAASSSRAGRVSIVLGAYESDTKPLLLEAGYTKEPIINPHWERGMGSSLKAGLSGLLEAAPDTEAVVVSVCDQPYLSTPIFDALIAKAGKGRIIASQYGNGASGVPVLFGKDWFPALLALNDQAGAKALLSKHPEQVQYLPFEQGHIDIDTLEDWESIAGSWRQ